MPKSITVTQVKNSKSYIPNEEMRVTRIEVKDNFREMLYNICKPRNNE